MADTISRYNHQRQSLSSSEESHHFLPYQRHWRNSEPRIITEEGRKALEQRDQSALYGHPCSRSLHNIPSSISTHSYVKLPSISHSANTSVSSLPSLSSSWRSSMFEVLPTLSEEGNLYIIIYVNDSIIV